MSNAKGSDNKSKITQPVKVVAQSRSEANAAASQDLRNKVQKLVAMPASAVRAAMTSTIAGAASAKVAYDVLNRFLSMLETGHAIDQALLKQTKGKFDTLHVGDSIVYRSIGKTLAQITHLNDVLTRIVSYHRTYVETPRATDTKASTLSKPKTETARGTDVRVKTIGKNISTTYYSGRWTDPVDLTFATASTDQDLLQGFPNRTVEGVTFSDYITRIVSYSRPKADTARGTDVKTAVASKILPVVTTGSYSTGTLLSWDAYGAPKYQNYIQYPEDFANAYWNSRLSILSSNELAPDGTYTATKFIYRLQYANIRRDAIPLQVGNYYMYSVYAKVSPYVRYFALVGSDFYANFDLVSGTTAGTSAGTQRIENVGNGWYRCSVNFLAATASNSIAFWLGGYNGNIWPSDSNVTMSLWGAKVEIQFAAPPTPYIPVSYSSYENKNLFDNTSSYDLSGSWTKVQTTVTADAATAPDNSSRADKLIGVNGITTRKSIYQGVTLYAGRTYTYSVYLKQAGFTKATIWFDSANITEAAYVGSGSLIDLTNGTRGGSQTTVVDAGNGWYRCYVTGTPTATGVYNLQVSLGDANGVGTATGDGVSGVYIWGGQIELGSTPTTYRETNYSASTTQIDYSPTNNSGIYSASSYLNYPLYNPAGYLTFNSTYTQKISSSYITASPGPQIFTVAALFRTSVASGAKIVGYENNNNGMVAVNYDRHLVMGTDGYVRFGTYNGTLIELKSATALNDNQWHYVVGTFSANGYQSLYVDGFLVNKRSVTTPQSFAGYWDVCGPAAGWTNSGNNYFTGDIAKIDVWGSELTASQVLTNYNLLANRFGLPQRNADPTTINDAKQTSLAKPKTETISLAELKRINFGKVAADIFRANDASTRLFTKKIMDVVSAFHDASLLYNDTKSRGDTGRTTDLVAKIVSFARTFTDTSRAPDSIAKVQTKAPKLDYAIVSDRVVRAATFNRIFADTEHTADTMRRVVSYNRTKSDTSRGTDAIGKYFSKAPFYDTSKAVDVAKRTIQPKKTDTSRATDSLSRTASFNRAFSSTITSTHSVDVVSTTKSYVRTFLQTAKSQDSFAKVWTVRRNPADITHAGSETFVRTLSKPRTDVARGTDVFAKVVSYNRTKADTAHAGSETFKRTVSKPKADVARSTDLITAKVFSKKLADVLRVSDYMYVSGYTHPGSYPPADASRIRDQFTKIVSWMRSYADSARGTDTRKTALTKTVGENTYKVYTDFSEVSELVNTFELLQNYSDYRTEWMKVRDAAAKLVSKNFNATTTYYRNSTWTDYNDLTFGQTSSVVNDDPAFSTTAVFDQDLFMSFAQAYTDATERATAADNFTKVLFAVRTQADATHIADAPSRQLSRTVGDVRSNVYNDVAELFYTNEYYSGSGGYGAVATIDNNYPTYSVTIYPKGTGYTVGQFFSIPIPNGTDCQFTVSSVDGNGGITLVSVPSGTPPKLPAVTSYFTDYADLTFGTGSLDQDLAQYNALTYTYPGPFTSNVGPATPNKISVLGQELLFTLASRADGDTARSTDAIGKTYNKQARQYLPQGYWNDFSELSFATGFDQDLLQTFVTTQPDTFNVLDVMSRVTLGPIKGVTDRARATELPAKFLTKGTKADVARGTDAFPKTYSISAGAYTNRIWRDYNEIADAASTFSIFAEMPLSIEGKYELIQTPDVPAKNFTKVLVFPFYTWRDFNELTFGTAVDEEITFTWGQTFYTEITRVAENVIRFIQPRKSDTVGVPDPLTKTMSRGVGDTTLNDHLTNNPEYIPNYSLVDESLLPQYPNYKIDRSTAVDAKGAFLSKVILGTGPIRGWNNTGYDLTNFDETVMTYGVFDYIGNNTFPDVKFTDYTEDFFVSEDLPTPLQYGSDSALSTDIFTRRSTYARTFSDTIHVAEYALIQKNGGPLFTIIRNTVDVARGTDAKAKNIIKGAGYYKSYYSLWYDFAELEIAAELAQYYSTPVDSTVEVSRTIDQKANFLTKVAGRTQNIFNTFDSDLFFNEDLVQIFDQSWRTDIIFNTDSITKVQGKTPVENPHVTDPASRYFEKKSLGNYLLTTEGLLYSPDYLPYYDYEEYLKPAYPDRKIELIMLAETKPITYGKAAGLAEYYYNSPNFGDELTSFDQTLVAYYDIILNQNPAPSVYNRYLDSIIFDELDEQIKTPIRFEPITIVEYFQRTVSYHKTFTDVSRATDTFTRVISKGGGTADIARGTDAKTKQYSKNPGTLFLIWTDYNELTFGTPSDQELLQLLSNSRYEYLTSVENFAKRLNKPKADTSRATDSRTLSPTKGLTETPRAPDSIGKFVNIAQVGNSTSTFWLDLNEITTYDETLLTYGYMKTIKFDSYGATDAIGKTYTVAPGNYRTRIWGDFAELDYYNDITQSYTPYTTENINPFEAITKRLNKSITEIPRASDSGFVRNFNNNAYYVDTSPYYASDYYSDGVTTSTF